MVRLTLLWPTTTSVASWSAGRTWKNSISGIPNLLFYCACC